MKGRVVLVVLLCFLASPLFASQIANHIRIAYKAMDDPRTPDIIREILSNNKEAYAAGAAGPDILTNLTGQHSAIAHLAHYSRTSDLITNMIWLLSQGKDPNTESYLAYVLGWLAHGYLDIYEHGVVDQYGGYYKVDPEWHKKMEMFETSHVFAISEYPSSIYIAKRKYLPSLFLKSAFTMTYGSLGISGATGLMPADILGHVFDSGIIHTEAYTMELFTSNLVTEHEASAKQYGLLNSITGIKVGQMPQFREYEDAMNPLWIGVDYFGYANPAEPRDGMRVDVTYLLNDNRMKVSYISDWYAANDKALEAIVGAYGRIATSIHRYQGDIVIDSDFKTGMPNYDWDAGRPEGQSDQDLRSLVFRPAEALSLLWEIRDRDSVVDHGTKEIPVRRQYDSGTYTFTIPLSSALSPPSRDRDLELRATLRMISDNPHLHPDKVATAFRFSVQQGKTQLVEARKVPIEAVDRKKFHQPAQMASTGSGPAQAPVVTAPVEDLLAKLRDAASRSAALAAQAHVLAGKAAAEVGQADDGLSAFDQAVTRYQADLAALRAQFTAMQASAQQLPGLTAQAVAAAKQVSQAIEDAGRAEAEACRTTGPSGTDPVAAAASAAGFARLAQTQYAQAASLLGRIHQIQLDVAAFNNDQTAIANQSDALGQMLQPPAALLQSARDHLAQLEETLVQLKSVQAEGAALYSQAVTAIDALPPSYASWKTTATGLYGQIQANVSGVNGISASDQSRIKEVEQDLSAARSVLQSVAAGFAQLKLPAVDANLIRDAESWVSAAEIYVSRAGISADNAARCANNPAPAGEPDWDGAADAGTSSAGDPDWEGAADQAKTTIASKTPEHAPPSAPEPPPPAPPDNPPPDGSDNSREAAKSLTKVLIDIWNQSVTGGSNPSPAGGNDNPGGNRQDSGGCLISGDARYQSPTWYLFQNTQGQVSVYTIAPGPSENVHTAPLSTLVQVYGHLLGTYSSADAAIAGARTYCPSPFSVNVVR